MGLLLNPDDAYRLVSRALRSQSGPDEEFQRLLLSDPVARVAIRRCRELKMSEVDAIKVVCLAMAGFKQAYEKLDFTAESMRPIFLTCGRSPPQIVARKDVEKAE